MSAIHEFKCDGCNKKVTAYYNGEHYLPPTGWVRFYSDETGETLDQHLCEMCRPKPKPKRKTK